MKRSLVDLGQQLMDAAKRAGADACDAMVVDGVSHSIEVRGGELEQAERAEGIDIGLRVMLGARQACVSASDIGVEAIELMAQRAVEMARHAPDDAYLRQASADQLARDWDVEALELFDPAEEPSAAQLQATALEAEAAALEVSGVMQSQSAGAAFGARRIHLCMSNGFSGGYARTDHGFSCVAIAGTGSDMERDYDGDSRIFRADLREAFEVGRCAGERAVARQGARKPPTGVFPVLYDERISSGLIGHLLAASNGSAVARGASWLQNDMHSLVLPQGTSLLENPHRKRTGGSRPFDGEGLPVAERAIVADGILQQWTLDLSTAAQLGLQSTGSAMRGPSGPPAPGVGNVTMTPGLQSREDLIRDMGTGLLLTSLIGASINATTGDYSRGASGFWVENGEIAYPVNECTIAGNLREILQNIIPANDGRAHLSRVVPSLLVPSMAIAGE
jgi:PmbA protein